MTTKNLMMTAVNQRLLAEKVLTSKQRRVWKSTPAWSLFKISKKSLPKRRWVGQQVLVKRAVNLVRVLAMDNKDKLCCQNFFLEIQVSRMGMALGMGPLKTLSWPWVNVFNKWIAGIENYVKRLKQKRLKSIFRCWVLLVEMTMPVLRNLRKK